MGDIFDEVGVGEERVLVDPRHRGIRADGLDSAKAWVTVECAPCGTREEVLVRTEGYVAWVGGEKIQRAMPEMSQRDREKLMSGLCDKCQDEVFGEGAGCR